MLPSLLDVSESLPLSACGTGSAHALVDAAVLVVLYVGVAHDELATSGGEHAG